MTTSNLRDQIARAAYTAQSLSAEDSMKRDDETGWDWADRLRRMQADSIAAAIYPLIAREKAEARDALARRIEAVRALHHPWGDTLTGKYICDACDHPLPCPTIRALDGEV